MCLTKSKNVVLHFSIDVITTPRACCNNKNHRKLNKLRGANAFMNVLLEEKNHCINGTSYVPFTEI